MTTIKSELSKNSKYWISKNRYLELKNFCLQYEEWKKALAYLNPEKGVLSPSKISPKACYKGESPTEWLANRRLYFKGKIDLVDEAAQETDEVLGEYIKLGVTSGASYDVLNTKYEIPCGREKYYELYRRFFWILSLKR